MNYLADFKGYVLADACVEITREPNALTVYHCLGLYCTSATKRGSKNEKQLFVVDVDMVMIMGGGRLLKFARESALHHVK